MSEDNALDPYKPPAAEVANSPSNPPTVAKGAVLARVLAFLSPSGSFSRVELLIATVILLAIGVGLSVLFPLVLSAPMPTLVIYGLYLIWGAALGKRSRDLGTTFTYGMLVGALFPIIGLVFLFQEGAKGRASRSLSAAD
jgi:hypothetical protein